MSTRTGDQLPVKDNRLSDVFNSKLCLLDYRIDGKRGSYSVFDGVSLCGLDVYNYETPVARGARRTTEHIRTDKVDDYLISLPLCAAVAVTQNGKRGTVEPGSFAFISTGKPFETLCLSDSHKEYLVKVSGSMLRQRIPFIDECCASIFAVREGAGTMMKSLLGLALGDGKSLSPKCGTQFAKAVIETIASATLEAPEFDRFRARLEKPNDERIRDVAMEYIESHLSDPALCVAAIASYCKISIRSLHTAFATSGMSVSSYIREERLLRCREALLNVYIQDKSITTIAMRWGFNDPAHFSSLYRVRFGKSPSEDRVVSNGF